MYQNNYLYFLTYARRDFSTAGHLLMSSQECLEVADHPHAVELAKRIVAVCPISSMLPSYELTTLSVSAHDKLTYTEVGRKSAEAFLMDVMQKQSKQEEVQDDTNKTQED